MGVVWCALECNARRKIMIGKTRHSTAEVDEKFDPEVGRARGILRRGWPAGKLRHWRKRPSAELAAWIAHYWFIEWDLRGCEPQLAENLPHPNVHLIFEKGTSVVSGVQARKFSRVLEGKAQVFGVKFRPGGFRPFFRGAVAELANRVVAASSVFGKDLAVLERVVLSESDPPEMIRAAEEFIQAQKPKADPMVGLAGKLVERILREPEIKTVDDVAKRMGIGKRRLQRIFHEYVGASPKWVIRRYRLHELVEKLNAGGRIAWAEAALELGYFDQAHLIRDFKAVVGWSPEEYRRKATKANEG
jgi:AraC-like DNA-binding protein